MAKTILTGFPLVAVIRMSGHNYSFALYDETVRAGDNVLVTGAAKGEMRVVSEVIPATQLSLSLKNSITAEVICKVDLEPYNNRVQERKRKANTMKVLADILAQRDPEVLLSVLTNELTPEERQRLSECQE